MDFGWRRGHPGISFPHIVPTPWSDPELIDPEEAFVSSIASCHMLFFLSIAVKRKLIIDVYEDQPCAYLEKNKKGKLMVKSIVLRPKVTISNIPHLTALDTLDQIHHEAHERCFLANSVITKISIEY